MKLDVRGPGLWRPVGCIGNPWSAVAAADRRAHVLYSFHSIPALLVLRSRTRRVWRSARTRESHRKRMSRRTLPAVWPGRRRAATRPRQTLQSTGGRAGRRVTWGPNRPRPSPSESSGVTYGRERACQDDGVCRRDLPGFQHVGAQPAPAPHRFHQAGRDSSFEVSARRAEPGTSE